MKLRYIIKYIKRSTELFFLVNWTTFWVLKVNWTCNYLFRRNLKFQRLEWSRRYYYQLTMMTKWGWNLQWIEYPCSVRQVRYDVCITTKFSKSFVMFLYLIIIKTTREYDWRRPIRVYVIIFALLKPQKKKIFQLRLLIKLRLPCPR